MIYEMKLLHAGCKLNAMLKNELNMHLKLPFGSQLINFTFFKEISIHTLNAAYDGICNTRLFFLFSNCQHVLKIFCDWHAKYYFDNSGIWLLGNMMSLVVYIDIWTTGILAKAKITFPCI